MLNEHPRVTLVEKLEEWYYPSCMVVQPNPTVHISNMLSRVLMATIHLLPERILVHFAVAAEAITIRLSNDPLGGELWDGEVSKNNYAP